MNENELVDLCFRFHWRQRRRHDDRFKAAFRVRAVAERFVIALPAAAQANRRASVQVLHIAIGVTNFNVAFDTQRAISVNRNFGSHEFLLL